jgi:hypothetical protein
MTLEQLTAENDELKRVLKASDLWRRCYADAKYRMYSMGGEWEEYAMGFMPCSEGPLERAVHKALGPELTHQLRAEAWKWHEDHEAKYAERTRLVSENESGITG